MKNTETKEFSIDDFAGVGFEGIRADDYAVPFLRVLQSNSPEVVKGDPAYIPGAEAGMFVNTLTHEVYGTEIELVPIKCEPIWLEYSPKVGDKKGEFKGKHPVNSVPVKGNVYDGLFMENGNEIKETLVFYCLVKGHETELPVCFSLTASMIKHGKTWNALIYTVRTPSGKQAPYFSSYWKISTSLNTKDGNRWYNIGSKSANIERTGFVPEEVFRIAMKTRKLLENSALSADFSQLADDGKEINLISESTEY